MIRRLLVPLAGLLVPFLALAAEANTPANVNAKKYIFTVPAHPWPLLLIPLAVILYLIYEKLRK